MLKMYRSHKVVQAMKIADVRENKGFFVLVGETPTDAPEGEQPTPHEIEVARSWYQKHDIDRNWYYVLYEDGYASASPPEAFEGGYTEVDPLTGMPPA